MQHAFVVAVVASVVGIALLLSRDVVHIWDTHADVVAGMRIEVQRYLGAPNNTLVLPIQKSDKTFPYVDVASVFSEAKWRRVPISIRLSATTKAQLIFQASHEFFHEAFAGSVVVGPTSALWVEEIFAHITMMHVSYRWIHRDAATYMNKQLENIKRVKIGRLHEFYKKNRATLDGMTFNTTQEMHDKLIRVAHRLYSKLSPDHGKCLLSFRSAMDRVHASDGSTTPLDALMTAWSDVLKDHPDCSAVPRTVAKALGAHIA